MKMAATIPPARRNTTIVAIAFYLITLPFLILVSIGNTHINHILNDIYFFKLDVSQIIPISVANSKLLNSVARSLGLHDFYQVGLWNFCEGYNNEGVTYCSEPTTFYWFNPVEVLVGELLAGATIALPSEVSTILMLLRIGSQIMYAFFTAGTVINFVLMLSSPLVMYTRWFTIPVTIVAAISGLIITVAAIIATVISVAAKVALTAQDELNISAEIGIKMFVFMWIAAILSDLAFILHAAMGCCCKPDRKRTSREKTEGTVSEKQPGKFSMPSFIRRRKGASGPSPPSGETTNTATTTE